MCGSQIGECPSLRFLFFFPSIKIFRLCFPERRVDQLRYWLVLMLGAFSVFIGGCGGPAQHYRDVEQNLRASHLDRADQIIADAEEDYGSKSRLLYLMDRGMTLHVAHRYQESNQLLEEADQLAEELYTSRIRSEFSALLINETQKPFKGEPYEQVMINVLKALNYASMGEMQESLVEVRRIDHRLNVLMDSVESEDYHEDPFARYLTGILYEGAGDLNNAYVAYRKSYQAYRDSQNWVGVNVPPSLKADLLRITDRLHLTDEHTAYSRAFFEQSWDQPKLNERLAHLVVFGLHGSAPRLEDIFIDVPVSREALNVVRLTQFLRRRSIRGTRGINSLSYGLMGHKVRVAVPRLVAEKSQMAALRLQLIGTNGAHRGKTLLVQNLSATAQKNLDDQYASIVTTAVARAVTKMAVAEGMGFGASASIQGNETGHLVGAIVAAIARVFAVETEEVDKRSWRTLPDEIHLGRFSVSASTYTVRFEPLDRHGRNLGSGSEYTVTLNEGQFHFVTERILF